MGIFNEFFKKEKPVFTGLKFGFGSGGGGGSEEFSATCLLYTSPSPRDATLSRMPSSA